MNRKRLCVCSQFLKHHFAIYWFFSTFFSSLVSSAMNKYTFLFTAMVFYLSLLTLCFFSSCILSHFRYLSVVLLFYSRLLLLSVRHNAHILCLQFIFSTWLWYWLMLHTFSNCFVLSMSMHARGHLTCAFLYVCVNGFCIYIVSI